MSKIRREVEVRGSDIERAVGEGLAKLGLGRSEVVVEVVDEGSRGLLGLGSRDAVVVVKEITPTGEAEPEPIPKPSAPVAKVDKEVPVKPKPEPNALAGGISSEPRPPQMADSTSDQEGRKAVEGHEPYPLENEQEIAIQVISQLLDLMRVDAQVTGSVSEADDLTGKRMNIIDIRGEELGVLIGPRGDTLSSLQYISRLMVGHKLHHRSNFVVDVEGYRNRRELALRRLAERMADKVIKRGRAMTLEPMPPNERRIIHITLREHDEVETHSVGEGDRRKVRIATKR